MGCISGGGYYEGRNSAGNCGGIHLERQCAFGGPDTGLGVAAMMPLWFWTIWQLLGLGLMAFGMFALVLALMENKKAPRLSCRSVGRKGKSSTKSITEEGGFVK